MKKRFTKDERIKVVSIEEFYERTNYLENAENSLWGTYDPTPDSIFYKFTDEFLISIIYTWKMTNFGENLREKIDEILLAYRDGITEYKLLEERIISYKEELNDILEKNKKQTKKSKSVESEMQRISDVKNFLINNFSISQEKINEKKEKSFDDYIEKIEYEPSIKTEEYVVLDVETNGLSSTYCDLLSITIYDPSKKICYSRYLPLELQPLVLTTNINGINEETIKGATHISQKEFDEIIDYFDLTNKTILVYCGRAQLFDECFLRNYCIRHKLSGFERFKYKNIKDYICIGRWENRKTELTKDNLCKALGIQGVSKVHTGKNDCVLEWQLFEKLSSGKTFFIGNELYTFSQDYIIPISVAIKTPKVLEYANIDELNIVAKETMIYKYSFPESILKDLKKFPTNITGIAVEHAINVLLDAEKQNNQEFLIKNKNKLKFLGRLESDEKIISIKERTDGLIDAVEERDQAYVEEVNNVTKTIIANIEPVIAFVKNEIFRDEKILSQEMVISSDNKILALCDLSSKNKVLEIKTSNVFDQTGKIKISIAKQLAYQAKNRDLYLLWLNFNLDKTEGIEKLIGVDISIFKIDLLDAQENPNYEKMYLWKDARDVLDLINQNPTITIKEMAIRFDFYIPRVSRILNVLKRFGYIERVGSKQKGSWKVKKGGDEPFYVPYNLQGYI